MKIIFDIIFLSFLTIILYSQFSTSKENEKVKEVNKRDITDEEFHLLKNFYKKRILFFIIEIILFIFCFVIIINLLIKDFTVNNLLNMFNGKSLDFNLILEILILLIFSIIIGVVSNLNYQIFLSLKNKKNIKLVEGICIQTKSLVKKKNRRNVKYAVELTDAIDYSKNIFNLRQKKDKFVIEKLINPNDRIFIFSINEEIFIMIRNNLFFKNNLYMEEIHRQRKAKEISKNVVIRT